MGSSIPDRGPVLLAVDIAFMSTAFIAYALRCYVRLRMVKAFGIDDWLMALATIFFIGYATSSIQGVRYGTGRHYADLAIEDVQRAKHCWWFCYLFYCCSMICSKTSIGFFLLRIAVRKVHTWIIYTAMLISVVAGSTFFFVTLFQCQPISFFWDKTQSGGGSCINNEVIVGLGYLYSVFSIISDFTFALLPALLVMNLQLKRRTKLALIPLLAMGCIASSAVVARVPYLPKFQSEDFLWDTLDIAVWSTVEQGLAITAGSLATLRPLFALVLFKLGLSTKPINTTPSSFCAGSQSISEVLGGSRRRPSRNELDMYTLSPVTSAERRAEAGMYESTTDIGFPKSPNWYQTQFEKVKRGSFGRPKKIAEDTGSKTSLHEAGDKSEGGSMGEEGNMQIMVSRSFLVTEAERLSYVDKDRP